jgi:hypothetical protein
VSNLDEALERFHQVSLEYGEGLANHGPMAAEALESLGHPALIPAFVNIYVPRLSIFEPGQLLSRAQRGESLGDVSRSADWVATYESRLESEPWAKVLGDEAGHLLPGLFAGAGHGLLRTAHAIRALEREDSPLRRRELARGLAYWAARFQLLPGKPGDSKLSGTTSLDAALAGWPLLEDASARVGLFTEVVQCLDEDRVFAEAFEAVAIPDVEDVDAFLDTLCLHAAEIYVGNPHARVAFVHGLTISTAVRTLVPYLSVEMGRVAASYALQAMGALLRIFGNREALPEHDDEVIRVTDDWNEIRYHAACSIQEHSIKMVDACWREDARRPNSIFRRAAADAALQIEGRGQAMTC